MNQLSLLERRRFLETVMIIRKQLPNNVVIVKIQAIILNEVGDIFLKNHGVCLPRKQIKNSFSLIKQFHFCGGITSYYGSVTDIVWPHFD